MVDPDLMQPYLSRKGPEQPGALLKRVQEQQNRRAKIDALCQGSTTILVEGGPDQHPMRVTLIPLGSVLSQYMGKSLLFVITCLGVTLGCTECAKLGKQGGRAPRCTAETLLAFKALLWPHTV